MKIIKNIVVALTLFFTLTPLSAKLMKKKEGTQVQPTQVQPTNGGRAPVQRVASANRAAKSTGRDTVKLTPSQVAIAKKLGVPLEDYARQVKEINAHA